MAIVKHYKPSVQQSGIIGSQKLFYSLISSDSPHVDLLPETYWLSVTITVRSMEYTFHHKLILRTPVLPFKANFTMEELASLFRQSEVREALYLASPNLVSEFDKWTSNGFSDKERVSKLFQTLHKYALRMHTRCTPFGLYAMCGTVEWGNGGTIVIPAESIYRKTRPDMLFTGNLIEKLSKLESLQPVIRYYPNNTLYLVGERYRFIEYTLGSDTRNYQISAVDRSPYLDLVLQTAQRGATISELSETLLAYDHELQHEETIVFVNELIESSLLVHELEPALSGSDIFGVLQSRFNQLTTGNSSEEIGQTHELLQAIQSSLYTADGQTGNPISVYRDLENKLEAVQLPVQKGKLLQTDLFFAQPDSNYTLDASVQTDLTKALTVLNYLSVKPEKTRIGEFTNRFFERYEYREIPLAQALDHEIGLGYASNTGKTGDYAPLIEQIPLLPSGQASSSFPWDQNYSFILQKLLTALKSGDYVISINPEDFSKAEKPIWTDLPDTISVFFRHCGTKILLKNAGGSSAVNMIGRFTQSNPEIAAVAREITAFEQSLQPDAILAEIVHLPENRTGNILARDAFRNFEIPYLAQSGLPEANQLPIDDLYLSVRNNKLVLRSGKWNKRIIPRLGNAHNYHHLSLPVYHFLCDYQFDNGRSGLQFDWGPLRNEFAFLPRVETGNVILSPATWLVRQNELSKLTDYTHIQEWKSIHAVPDMVLIPEGDNELLIHLGTEEGCAFFIQHIRNRKSLTLNEFIPNEGSAVVTNESDQLKNNEFIAFLQRSSPASTSQHHAQVVRKTATIQRTFLPGSEWLYSKWYCGNNTADVLLTEVLKPLVLNLLEEKLIDSFFFIRYQDPEQHLRIRFHLTDSTHSGIVMTLLQKELHKYSSNGLLADYKLDTYQRELERYGPETMWLSEQVFFEDSLTTLELLDQIDNSAEGQEFRWQFALLAIDRLFDDFGWELSEKLRFVSDMREAFAAEFKVNANMNKLIDKKYRTYRSTVESLLQACHPDSTEERLLMEQLIQNKSERLAATVSQIRAISSQQDAYPTLENLSGSYVHMMINRIFRSKQRLHELMIYDFLLRFYKSESARSRQTTKAAQLASNS